MKNMLSTTAALVLVSVLSACGGGGATGGGSVTPPVVTPPTAPSATDAVTLAAWAKNGGTTAEFENGVMRTKRSVTIDGVRHTAYVDVVPGYGDARVTYTNSNGQTVYELAQNNAPTGVAPTGVYTGEVDATWKSNDVAGTQTGTGRIAITLDAQAGTAGFNSIVAGQNGGIEHLGTAQVAGNTLVANDLTVRHRDGEGFMLFDEAGTVDGRMIAGTDTSAIVGTIASANSDAGFTTGYDEAFSADWIAGNPAAN